MAYSGYDITLDTTDPGGGPETFFRVADGARMSDITPSSTRRSDGDARYQLIPSESYWGQQDWTAGIGRKFPPDPAAFYGSGTIDSSKGTALTQGLHITGNWATPASAAVPLAMIRHRGIVYVAVNDAGTGKLYSFDPSTATWTFQVNLAWTAVTSMCSFRKDIWIAYGSAANVQKWDGTTLTTLSPNFTAQILCPYSSMVFYVVYDSSATKTSWRINRYDPENTGAVPDLAIIPRGNETSDYARSLVVVGPDLFLVCQDSLWKFTSPNGNSGTLVGPVDEWVPTNIYGVYASGYAAAAFEGSLIYSAGATLRRYFPGGQPALLWPVLPNENVNADLFCDMVVAHDRLYLVASSTLSTGSETLASRLYVWTGKGMHWIATMTNTKSGGPTVLRPRIAADNSGMIALLDTSAGSLTTGSQLGYTGIPGFAATSNVKYATTSTYSSSYLDFGMSDLEKVLPYIAVTASLPSNSTYSISVTLLDMVTGDSYALSQSGTYSTATNNPSTCYYRHSTGAPLVSKKWWINVAITGPSAATATGRIVSIHTLPNPSYPVRYGFRCEVEVGVGVRARDNLSGYGSQAAVSTALTYLRAFRSSRYPYTLKWVDGQTYTVRLNTITFTKGVSIDPTDSEEYWRVTLDMQQLST